MPPSAVRRFRPAELERFLVAVDAELRQRSVMVMIGGGAAALGYGVRTATQDIDTLTNLDGLGEAIAAARKKTGLNIPIEPTPVADLPYEFESRLERVLPALRHLALYVPEANDLVLSKLMRANAGDLAATEELHQHHPLSFEILVERFRDEMSHAIGDRKRLEQNFLLGVHVLFSELKREEARRALSSRKNR